MFGCFKLILSMIFSLIVGIAVVCFFCFGGVSYVSNFIDSHLHPAESEMRVKAQKLADFSKVPQDYKLTRTVNMLGVNAVIAKDKKNDQKMALVDTGWLLNISKDDIRSNTIDKELKKVAAKFPDQATQLKNLEVKEKGFFKAFDQNIPYVNVKVVLSGKDNRTLEGIIGVAKTPGNKNNLVVSMSDTGKYKQDVAEKFFKNVKFNKQGE